MSKYVKQVLFELVSNFAQYHDDETPPYWWGHDTNLGEQKTAFAVATRKINKYKREQTPNISKKTAYSSFTPERRKIIAEAIFGKGKIPAYWYGSTGEYDVLIVLANVKGAML